MAISPYTVLVSLGILVLSNTPLGLWVGKRERKFLLLAPLIASMRLLTGTLGAYVSLNRNMLRLMKGWIYQ